MSIIEETLKNSFYRIKILRMIYKNSTFKHYRTDHLYKVLDFSICEKTHRELIIYKNIDNEQVWTRTTDEFFEKIKYENTTRFVKVKD